MQLDYSASAAAKTRDSEDLFDLEVSDLRTVNCIVLGEPVGEQGNSKGSLSAITPAVKLPVPRHSHREK
jgi:hypothetical protein